MVGVVSSEPQRKVSTVKVRSEPWRTTALWDTRLVEAGSHTISPRRGSECLTCLTDGKQNILPVATRGEPVWERGLRFCVFPLALSLDHFHNKPKELQREVTWSQVSYNSALLPSTILLPSVQTLSWHSTSLPHSPPAEAVAWIYNPLEPNPPKLWSNYQNIAHQSVRLRTCDISEKPQREQNTFLTKQESEV